MPELARQLRAYKEKNPEMSNRDIGRKLHARWNLDWFAEAYGVRLDEIATYYKDKYW